MNELAIQVYVIIPALNEEAAIGGVVKAALSEGVQAVIVVDNGSSDATAARAEEAGAIVVTEPRRGYGFACNAGSLEAISRGADLLAFMDGDHSSDPHQLGRVLAPLEANEADLVLGSRVLGNIEPGAMLVHQRLGNRLAAAILRRLYGVTVTDLGPFRAIRSAVFDRLAMSEMTFGWPTEMTVKCVPRWVANRRSAGELVRAAGGKVQGERDYQRIVARRLSHLPCHLPP